MVIDSRNLNEKRSCWFPHCKKSIEMKIILKIVNFNTFHSKVIPSLTKMLNGINSLQYFFYKMDSIKH